MNVLGWVYRKNPGAIVLLAMPLALLLSATVATAQTPDEQAELAADAAGNTEEAPQGDPVGDLQCGPGTVLTTLHFSDFEANTGGWTAGGAPAWEHGAPILGVYESCDTAPRDEPSGAFSGTNVWGTNLNGCYLNSGLESLLSQTFDFSGLAAPIRLSWWHWYEVFTTFDMGQVIVNGGSPLWEVSTTAPTGYVRDAVDLSPFAGNASVAVDFRLFATTVVNRTGWYVDDVLIEYCAVPDDSETRATFEVTKEFTDGDNPTEVDVTINCFTGLPITQTQTIDETQTVEFIVTDFDNGELDCEITEEELFGYTPTYNPDGPGSYDAVDGCNFQDVVSGSENFCHIVNDADFVDVEIEKLWVIDGSGGDDLDTRYKLTLYCDAPIEDDDYCHGGGGGPDMSFGENGGFQSCKKFYGDDSEVFVAHVQPQYPSSHCWVDERVYDSSVEINNDCDDLNISAGTGDSCVITNTVFYEGIPTLSQYGMAIMALLMLGVGLVGFRRLV